MKNPEEEMLVDQALDNAYESNFELSVGRIAVETPPIYFTQTNNVSPDQDFGWCDMGTYLDGE